LFTVWDSGPGLSLSMQAQVFRPFATDGQSSGAGLGLAICHELALSLGATLTLEKMPEGTQGLQVQLRLPLSDSQSPIASSVA
jgi:two-component system sensor histidine kinase TctE